MSTKELGKGESMRVETPSGLNLNLFSGATETELDGFPIGMNLELFDDHNRPEFPEGARYKLTFYQPEIMGGEKVKTRLPGAIYVTDSRSEEHTSELQSH